MNVMNKVKYVRLNFFISYFYQLRFFPPTLLPISTALSDPAWYKREEPSEDKRGVILGIRLPELSHPAAYSCGCPCMEKNPGGCKFLSTYLAHLRTLDFGAMINKIEALVDYLRGQGKDIDGACLMVYETPDNLCSERGALIEWFKENGIKLKEYGLQETSD